ncbi:MAG: dipeptidase PepV [Halanaerobiales bacterium]
MYDKLNNRIDEIKDEIIGSAQKIIQIKSVESEAEEGMPFGQGVNECLETTLHIAELMGFDIKNVDGYAGHVELGDGDEILGILCHLDVVPEGSNWSYPPYGAEIVDGKLYGRGSIDDKGPAIAALYALKAVRDSEVPLKKKVRLIFGTDEESGWQGLDYYLKKEDTPDMAFTPDADFPVIHGEKGILTFNIKKKLENCTIDKIKSIKIKGGNAPNMVPDYCKADIETDYQEFMKEKMNKYVEGTEEVNLEAKIKDNSIIIESFGVSAHGSLPEQGKNAISQLMVFLDKFDILEGKVDDLIGFYNECIGMEYYGESMGCQMEDEVSGLLTFNVGMINISEDMAEIIVNIRYPVTVKYDTVVGKIKKTLDKYDLEYEELSHMEPLYVEKNDPLVRKLMKVYQEYTGDKSEPVTIGGGTYARAIDKAVAFGPGFPGREELAHQKDEFLSIDDLILIAKIYAAAIVELAGE